MKIVIKVQELTTYIAMRSILAALLLFQSASVRTSNSPAKKKRVLIVQEKPTAGAIHTFRGHQPKILYDWNEISVHLTDNIVVLTLCRPV